MVVSCTFIFLFVHFSPAICGMFWLESLNGADDFPRFVQQLVCCQPFFLALRMFESVLGVFGGCWMFVTCEKCWIFAFSAFAFFGIFLLFCVPACSSAVCVRTGVWKSLVSGSASILNAFWQGWIVVACFAACERGIFDNSGFLIFPGFLVRRRARPRFVYQLASGKPCSLAPRGI